MQGKDGRPYRVGGVWVRRMTPWRPNPPKVDRRPDIIQKKNINMHREAGLRAILFLLKSNKVPPHRILSAAFYPRRKHGSKKG